MAPKRPRIDGLDIHDVYQPVTDWSEATDYALMSCKLGEGRGPYRRGGKAYFEKFREHDVQYRGMYWWIRGDSSIQAQADRMLEAIQALGGLQVGEFVQCDWETTPGAPLVTSDGCKQWCDLVEAEWPGRVIVYSSDWLPDSALDADSRREFDEWFEAFPDFPLWFANYNIDDSKSTGGWRECEKYGADIWQWSSTVMVPGIANRCDVNQVMNWPVLDRLTLRAVEVEPPSKPQTPTTPPIVVKPQPQTPAPAPAGPIAGKVTEMLKLNHGEPGKDSWFNQTVVMVDGLHWSTGALAFIVNNASPPVPATPVTEDQIESMLTPIGQATRAGTAGQGIKAVGPSPYRLDGVAPNKVLHDLWLAAGGTER